MPDLYVQKTVDDEILSSDNAVRAGLSTGEVVPERTLAEMNAEADSNWHYVIVTDRFVGKYTLELWKGSTHVDVLKAYFK